MRNLQRQKLRRLRNGPDQSSSGVQLQQPIVAVPIGDEDLSGGGHRHGRRFAQMVPSRTRLKPASHRNARIIMARHELEHLVQGHIRQPHVSISVNSHSMWHVEDPAATLVDYGPGGRTQRQDGTVLNRSIRNQLIVVGRVEAPENVKNFDQFVLITRNTQSRLTRRSRCGGPDGI